MPDNIHFSSASLREFGARYSEALRGHFHEERRRSQKAFKDLIAFPTTADSVPRHVRTPMKTASLCALTGTLLAIPIFAAPPAPVFKAQTIDAKVGIGYGVAVGDINGDGKPDVVLVDKGQVAWYANPTWTKHIIAEKLTELDHVCLAVQDLDGDGKAEIAVGAGWNPGDTVKSGANFFLVPPIDRTQPWTPITLPNEPTVHRMHWIRTPGGRYDLAIAPLHGRGNKQGEGEGVRIQALRVPANGDATWRIEPIDSTLHMTHNFQPVRWEGKAWDELLVAGREGVFHFSKNANGWRRNQLVGNEGGQTNFVGAGEVRDGLLPAKQRFLATVEPMHGHQAVVYTAPPAGSSQKFWNRRVLDATLINAHAVACGDLLGTGSDQILVGWRAMNRPGIKVGIKLYTPLDAEGSQWRTDLIDDNTMACEDLRVADFNGDGRMDIIAAGRASHNLVLYLNETPKP